MPRANRTYVPGCVWHITHRCHQGQFLLGERADRDALLDWLFRARQRYDLCVLDYIVTSNHIHLLVRDCGRGEIVRAMQLTAGQVALAQNRRNERRGAFWQDRYHATAVATDDHLLRCIRYIDLNMVRAGVVEHPSAWQESGFWELCRATSPRQIINRCALMDLLGVQRSSQLQRLLEESVDDALNRGAPERRPEWTESVAVGPPSFLESFQTAPGTGRGRRISENSNLSCVRDQCSGYGLSFAESVR